MVTDAHALLLFFIVGLVAGFIDTLAGGGGLITLPTLLLSGMPTLSALATNKLQSTFGSATAAFSMLGRGRVQWSSIWPAFCIAFGASALGTVLVHYVAVGWMDIIIPVVLLMIAIYMIVAPPTHEVQPVARCSERTYRGFVVPLIGLYDGLFGPGTGSFFAVSLVALRSYGLIQATAMAKVLNYATNIASLLIFLMGGNMVWAVGLVMGSGQMLGAYCGAYAVVDGNAKRIRPVIICMCVAMLARYVWQKLHYVH